MFTKKELISIVLVIIVIGFVIKLADFISKIFYNGEGLPNPAIIYLTGLIVAALIIFINIFAKKAMAYYLDSTVEHRIWSFKRYGLYERSYFKVPIPLGIIFPFLLGILSQGFFKWVAALEYDVKPSKARAAKRHGFYRFSEMTEYHIGLIGAAGIVANLLAAIVGYLMGGEALTFAKMSIFLACLNMLPIGRLDGSKIFFGSKTLWAALAIICIIFLGYVILLQ